MKAIETHRAECLNGNLKITEYLRKGKKRGEHGEDFKGSLVPGRCQVSPLSLN